MGLLSRVKGLFSKKNPSGTSWEEFQEESEVKRPFSIFGFKNEEAPEVSQEEFVGFGGTASEATPPPHVETFQDKKAKLEAELKASRDKKLEDEAWEREQKKLQEKYMTPSEQREAEKELKEERDRRKDERDILDRKLKVAKLQADRAEAEERAAIRKLGESRWQRFERAKKRFSPSGITKAATLGGSLKVDKKRVGALYIGEGSKGDLSQLRMYPSTPSGLGVSRELRSSLLPPRRGTTGTSGLRETLTVGTPEELNLGGLRSAGAATPTHLRKLMTLPSPKTTTGNLSLLRGKGKVSTLLTHRSLSPLEQAVLHEVAEPSGDIDTKRSLISTMQLRGFPAVETNKAINSLIGKNLLAIDNFAGESLLRLQNQTPRIQLLAKGVR